MDERSKGIVEKFWENRNWNVNVENLFPLGAVILFRSAPRSVVPSRKAKREKEGGEDIAKISRGGRMCGKGVGSMPSDAVMAESSTYVERGRAK